MLTAKARPHYLQQTLTSWALTDGANDIVSDVVIALGRSSAEPDQRQLIKTLVPGARIWLDSDRANMSNGMHRAIAECASRVFTALKPDFLIFGEEDVAVSSDMLLYMQWAAEKFQDDQRVLLVNGHNRGGQGWDDKGPRHDADADQALVRLEPYMAAWVWGTWRDRWEKVLEPNWDYECNSGGTMDSGYDWNIATRIIPQGDYVAVVPDAARSQNIGKFGGWAAQPAKFEVTQSQSFRERRNPSPSYHLPDEEPSTPRVTKKVIPAADDPVEINDRLWHGVRGQLAFEVGANVGNSLPRLMSRFSRVVAFEPYDAVHELAAQFPRSDVRKFAISDHDGEVELRLVRDQMMSEGHEAFNRANPAERTTTWESYTVPCYTLDTISEEEGVPDFINVDVEGHELEVLRGAAGIVTGDNPPEWLVEFHSKSLYEACVTYLEKAGYDVETVRHPHYPVGSVNYYEHGWLKAKMENR